MHFTKDRFFFLQLFAELFSTAFNSGMQATGSQEIHVVSSSLAGGEEVGGRIRRSVLLV